MLLIDPANGEIVDANPAASRFYGYPLEQLKSMRIQDINTLTPEQVAQERHRADQESRNYFIFRHRIANGDVKTVEVHSHPYVFDGRTLLYSVIIDITSQRDLKEALWHHQNQLEDTIAAQTRELKEQYTQTTVILSSLLFLALLFAVLLWQSKRRLRVNQQKLEIQRRRLSDVLNGTDAGTWEWNIQTGDVHYNERWAAIIGYRLEELEPTSIKTWEIHTHPDDLKLSYEKMRQHFEAKTDHYRVETRMRHKDGHWVWVVDRGKVHQWDEEGKPLVMSGIRQDISQRKLAEQKLVEKEELLTEAQSIARLGNWETDRETMKTQWSEQVFRLLDIPIQEDNHSELIATLIHPEDRDLVANGLKEAFELNTLYHQTYRMLTPVGREFWVESRAVHKYDSDGQVVALQGTLQDITARKKSDEALYESVQWFKAIIQQTTEGISVADPEGNYTLVNPAFCQMMGYSEEELLQKTVFDMKAPTQDPSSFEKTKTTDEGLAVNVLLQRKDGSTFIAEVIGKMITINLETHVLGIVRDITSEVMHKEQITKLSQALEQSPVSVMIADLEGRLEYVNAAFTRITGYSKSEVLDKNPRFLQSGSTTPELYRELWQALKSGKSYECEIQNRKKNGELFWEFAQFAPVINEGQITHFLAIKEDITHRKAQEEKILHQAHFDSLTGLPNRFLSLDRLTQLINEARRNDEQVAVLFIDLDDFKKVNDSLGHEMGDKLLVEAAKRLQSVVRRGDTVGRLGGDEFIVLVGGLQQAEEVQPVAENLILEFRDAFQVDGRELLLTASIGISIFPDDSESPSALLKNADSAMYHSKSLGRNTYAYFTDAMNRQVTRRLELEEQIHGAMERGEFSVVFQPQFNTLSGSIMGAEVLLRWHNPALGHVSPGEFIPIAEQTGLIVPLGDFVLAEALSATRKWLDEGHTGFRIAVNLSPRQFRNPELVGNIERMIDQYGVEAANLELEITEGVLMTGHTYIDDALARLSAIGVSIAMDDFGTGYSSLSYLRSYPFNVLKIDQSFISDISEDPADRELIQAAISMAHGLNLNVVAEGVETAEQLAFLRQHNCDYVQGFYFSKPVSAEVMSAMLTDQSSDL